MKWCWTSLAWLFLAMPVNAQGPLGKPFGVGLIAGDPVGVSARYWFTHKHTLDMAMGYGYFPHYHGFETHLDYHYNGINFLARKQVPFALLFTIGVGGKLGYWHHHHPRLEEYDLGLGIRFPVGVTMVFSKVPFDSFLIVAPCLSFVDPEPFWFDLDISFGGRFYF